MCRTNAQIRYMDHIDRYNTVFSEYAAQKIEVFAFDQRVRLCTLWPTTYGEIPRY